MGIPFLVVLLRQTALLAVLSMVWVAGVWVAGAAAHEVSPAVADVSVLADRVELSIRLRAEPILAGMSLQGLANTADSPLAGVHDKLRADEPAALEAAFRAAWPELAARVIIQSGGARSVPELVSVSVPEVGSVDLPRTSVVVLMAPLPPGASPVEIGWDAAFGPLAIRQNGGGEDAYAAILQNGALSIPLPRAELAVEAAGPVFVRFILSGFRHIVPKGVDHMLFVLGLFFFSLHLRPLLSQVTAFTLAHTVTLALASLKIVTIPATVVEPLIAASIVYVAVENIFGGKIGVVRVAVVFCFGLLHGLGFASVLGDVGLQAGRFAVGLIGFNIGVELGQLAVISGAFLLLALPFGRKAWYRARIAVPASALIALVGAWWTVQRVFL